VLPNLGDQRIDVEVRFWGVDGADLDGQTLALDPTPLVPRLR
jgi:hypothetical protein